LSFYKAVSFRNFEAYHKAMFKIGLVLSGGGARSIAHLGVLQALEDLGLRPQAIAGASAGAVLGALYAAGHSPHQILTAVKTNAGTGLVNRIFAGSGLFTVSGLTQFFKDTGLPAHFENLAIPLWVSATDLRSCQPVVF
jgi:NTE family protein